MADDNGRCRTPAFNQSAEIADVCRDAEGLVTTAALERFKNVPMICQTARERRQVAGCGWTSVQGDHEVWACPVFPNL